MPMTNDIQSDMDKLNKLADDARLKELEEELNKPNIFYILKLQGMEIRHSNFLGWLLNPNESHGLKDAFLRRFIEKLPASELRTCTKNSNDKLDCSEVKIHREWEQIDLLIEAKTFVICIENKIWSGEDKGDDNNMGQLQKYAETIEKSFRNKEHIFVFLTPDGTKPSDSRYITYTYHQIEDILSQVLLQYGQGLAQRSQLYLEDYLTVLRREIVHNDKTNDLAHQIYCDHANAIAFIEDARKAQSKHFIKLCKEFVDNNKGWKKEYVGENYVYFLTSALDSESVVPPIPKPVESVRRAIVYEVCCYPNQKVLYLQTPVPKSEYSDTIIEALRGLPNPIGTKNNPTKFFPIREGWDCDLMKLGYDAFEDRLALFFKEIKPRIGEIEKAILDVMVAKHETV